ncbi:zinc-ribbon domain-containing protein [Lentilactobacillus sp. SPB1-3]|uniref:Zinc-ribbon domain-containing protein n=1 Tax=Lentilactobacillus terminaliae TaxID=3003483 RepID=A0ACD5DFZ2_9LACO|nr:zinc ribbon domain-containing protein [Lentilactobacillus sp. SPB1-3]MCZ0976562.1 zinc-ribbon domain-containing protein [Lentilactobacillus sp. SPB1-3]
MENEKKEFCPYCGFKLDKDYEFCPKCGKRLRSKTAGMNRLMMNPYAEGMKRYKHGETEPSLWERFLAIFKR